MSLTENARSLRKNQTDAEHCLWQKLRNRQVLNLKFRRQVPVDHYIADFVCQDLMLIIELDGSQHMEQAEYDKQRTAFLEKRGFRVVRFWDNEVLNNGEGVLERIIQLVWEIQGKQGL